jgi:hypothetical protein
MLAADFGMLGASLRMLGADRFMLGASFIVLDTRLQVENHVNWLFCAFPDFLLTTVQPP